MHTSARKSGWKENKKTRDEIRQKIKKNWRCFGAINHIINTNIFDGLDEKKISDQQENKSNKPEGRSSVELGAENSTFSFTNTTNVVGRKKSRNSFHKSVIYDSGAANHLTFDKDRFVGEIR